MKKRFKITARKCKGSKQHIQYCITAKQVEINLFYFFENPVIHGNSDISSLISIAFSLLPKSV